jgi:site-specific recombinase XerD
MKLRKAMYTQDGVRKESKKWYAIWMDHSEILRKLPLFPDRKVSEELANRIDKLTQHRAVGHALPLEMARYVETMPQRIVEKLAEWGVLSKTRIDANRPLIEQLDEWKDTLRARGSTEDYVALSINRVRRILQGCDFMMLSDVSPSRVQTFLAGLREDRIAADGDKRRGISASTFNQYLSSCISFFRWMVREGRATDNPLRSLRQINVSTDRRHDRRALTTEELLWLLETTKNTPTRFGMTGKERALLYRLAVETGLRAGELRSLTASSFELDATDAKVTIKAAYSKSRRQDSLPVRAETSMIIREFLKDKARDARAFTMPIVDRVAYMVRADLADARCKWIAAAVTPEEEAVRQQSKMLCYRDDTGRVADFHAFRHTFISNLVAAGVHPKTAQTLARHSTITLTMDRYTHVASEAMTLAVKSLPDLDQQASKDEIIPSTEITPAPVSLSPDLSPGRDTPGASVEFHGVNGDRAKLEVYEGKTDKNAGFPTSQKGRPGDDKSRRKTALNCGE